MDDALKETTRKTARMLFHSIKSGVGFETWKKFDRDLARELSMFFTGKLYSREVISQKQRELCAVASLTVLNRRNEVRAHIHAALNVGASRQEVTEGLRELERAHLRSLAVARSEPEALARKAAVEYGWPAGFLARYFEKLRYHFGPRERMGVVRFFELAHLAGELDVVPELRFVELAEVAG